MKDPQREVEELRASVNCATVLEKATPPWLLDRKESSRRCLKYRRGAGEIVIVTHGGAGWWDPNSDAKGDVFRLVQHLEPRLNFGEVRKMLRPLAGFTPISRQPNASATSAVLQSRSLKDGRAGRACGGAPTLESISRGGG
jgi:hypothetical protein